MIAAQDKEPKGHDSSASRAAGQHRAGVVHRLAKRFGLSPRIATVVVIAAVAIIGLLAWPGNGRNPAPPRLGPPSVTVSKPLIDERIEWKEFTGQFEAAEYVEVRARVSGYLKSIHFEDGRRVTEGDSLFVIEPEPFEIALATAKAQLADAIAKMELAKVQLARTKELAKKQFAAASVYDERVAELRSATASVDIAKAAVATAELNLAYTRVTAPVTGRVSRNEVSVGNLVSSGTNGNSTLLTTIVSLDPIDFVFDVSEADSLAYRRAVETGEVQSARENLIPLFAQLPDEKSWTRQGTVNFVDNRFNPSTGTIRVRASFPNPDLFLTPGQFGRVLVPVSKPRTVMLVPEAAIASDQTRKIVFVVADDNTVAVRTVSLGSRVEGSLRIVRDGLNPDDRVIINGLMRVRPGAKVQPEEGRIGPADGTKP